MSDPLALVPLAVAAQAGHFNESDTSRLVAAGLTLLQRSAPLVRALAGKRSAILLPNSPTWLIALAASDGHGALLIRPGSPQHDVAHQLREANVGAVFTMAEFAELLPSEMVAVLLNDAPRSAQVIAPGRSATIDLGSHHGLSLEGDSGVEGRDEECVVVWRGPSTSTASSSLHALSHRELKAKGRAMIADLLLTPVDRTLVVSALSDPAALVAGVLAPLLAGSRVITMSDANADANADADADADAPTLIAALTAQAVSMLVANEECYERLLASVADHGGTWHAPSLLTCLCIHVRAHEPARASLTERWLGATGLRLTPLLGDDL